MKGESRISRRASISIVAAIVIIAGISAGLLLWRSQVTGAILQGSVVDESTGEAVYGVQISAGDRTTFRYTSSDYRLTGITPGERTVYVNAPGYDLFEEELSLERGINTLDVSLKGAKIPGLERIYVFSITRADGIELEIRFANDENRSILHYPGLDLALRGTLYAKDEAADSRSRILYEGPIEVFWDSDADPWKYRGYLPWSDIAPRREGEQFGILDVVLTIPGQGEYDAVVSSVNL